MAHITEIAARMALDHDFFENTYRQFPDIERLDFQEIMRMDIADMGKTLHERAAPWRQGINEKLKRDGFYGLYNDHEGPHVWSVMNRTTNLLRHAGASDDQVRCGIIIALLHDVGNRVDRNHHSTYSALSLPKIFTNYDPKDWRIQTVAAGVLLHDGMYGANIRGLAEINDLLYPAGTPQDERVIDPVPIAAVIAADKADIGRRRTPLKIRETNNGPLDIQTVLENSHTLASIFIEDAQLVPVKNTQGDVSEVTLQLDFSNIPDHHEEEIRKGLERFMWRADIRGMRVSKTHYSLYREHNITYAAILHSLIRRLYSQDLAMCRDALRILFPSMERFTIRTIDKTGNIAETDEHAITYGNNWKDQFRREWRQPQKSAGKQPTFYATPPILRSDSFLNEKHQWYSDSTYPDFPEEEVIYQVYQNIMNTI